MKSGNQSKIEYEYLCIESEDSEETEESVFDFILDIVWDEYKKTKTFVK